MHPHDKFFKAFLFVYAGFLVFHALQLAWTPLTILGAVAGLALAIVAHLRHSYATVILLVIHMGLEWAEYAQSGFNYSAKEMIFYAIHALLDAAFLWQEANNHLPRFRYWITGGVFTGLAIMALYLYNPAKTGGSEQESTVPVEAAVIGGILGCTFSHLLSKRRHEHTQN